jgi:DNA-binding IclR family transcriptional regulator
MATEASLTVLKAFKLLELFFEHPLLTTTRSAELLDVPRATAHRLLVSLREAGAIESTSEGHHRLSLRLFEIGALAPVRRRLCDHGRVPLEQLSAETGMTVHLAVRDGPYIVFLESIPGRGSRVPTRVGHRGPMHATGLGKLLLAYADPTVLDEVMVGKLHRFTANTIVTRERLEAELEEIRTTGVAYDREEIQPGLFCIAVPVRDHGDEVIAAASISMPTLTDARRRREFGVRLQAAVAAIESGLSWQPSLNWSVKREEAVPAG